MYQSQERSAQLLQICSPPQENQFRPQVHIKTLRIHIDVSRDLPPPLPFAFVPVLVQFAAVVHLDSLGSNHREGAR